VRAAQSIDQIESGEAVDAVVVAMDGQGPLELLGSLRGKAPQAAILVVTEAGREADGAVAMHAGAEDHLVLGSIPEGLLPRAVRYAVSIRRLRRELATTDEVTGLPNLRGFVPIAEHHLRMADRSRTPVVFLFVRIDGSFSDGDAREAAEVLLDAVRDADLPARVTDDTFAVLLTGEAAGAETLVLSRLVEAIAVHNAKQDPPRPLALSVGSALYEPEAPSTLSQILETAGRRLHDRPGG
jgi:diguanylate cyclase (GGDEF)-like protein